MKQSLKGWFETLTSMLLSMGFIKSRVDTSLFIKVATYFVICLLVYVDDIIFIVGDDIEVQQLIFVLNNQFALKYLGLLTYFLGIEFIKLCNDDLMLNQSKYSRTT